MPVSLLCPICTRAIEARHTAPSECPWCGGGLPAPLQAAARAALGRQAAPKPLLLRLLTFFLGFWGAIAAVVFTVNLLSDGTTYRIGESEVSREEFLAQAGGMLLAMAAAVPLACATAWGLYRERPWGRHAAFALFTLGFLGSVLTGAGDAAARELLPVQLGLLTPVLLALGWYFYGKRSVVAYYRALEGRREAADRETVTPAV